MLTATTPNQMEYLLAAAKNGNEFDVMVKLSATKGHLYRGLVFKNGIVSGIGDRLVTAELAWGAGKSVELVHGKVTGLWYLKCGRSRHQLLELTLRLE